MTSFFFNITEQRHKRSIVFEGAEGRVHRVDISNGIVFVAGMLSSKREILSLDNLDRMVMVVMAKRGNIRLQDRLAGREETVKEGEIGIFVSSKQKMVLEASQSQGAAFFVLFIADFFLKRYLSGDTAEPIDYLYGLMQEEQTLARISLLPIDALSLYRVTKLQEISDEDRMQSIRAEHRVVEFMIHRFGLLDIIEGSISEEERLLAAKAKAILLEDFVQPPTIELLAHRCATNASKLKKVFKKVYHITLYGYVQQLRMEEANLLLKEERLTIGEIAKRVGYRHQGHFSKRFFETYGIYPKMLRQ